MCGVSSRMAGEVMHGMHCMNVGIDFRAAVDGEVSSVRFILS